MSAQPVHAPWWRRRPRLIVMLLVLLVYLAVDALMLVSRPAGTLWDVSTNSRGVITWVDPNGPADSAGVRAGDVLLPPSAVVHPNFGNLVRRPSLRLRHGAHVRRVHAAPSLGRSGDGQAMVLVGAFVLLVGGLAWASGRRRAAELLGALSASAALALLGAVWGQEGHYWAIRLAFIGGPILFPVAWAGFFLSFPSDLMARPVWRLFFRLMGALALAALVAYTLCLCFVHLPYEIALDVAHPLLIGGMLLGLAGLTRAGKGEEPRLRQQRRIVAVGAALAVAPMLLLSIVPQVLLGRTIAPFTATALALAALPLGLSYAIVRYDLMELDVVIRRAVALLVGGLALVGLTVFAGVALHPLLPRLDMAPLIVAVLAGAIGGRYVTRWTQALSERLLSPELRQSRRLLAGLDGMVLTGEKDLPALASLLEETARAVTGGRWTRLLVRRRVPGAVFWMPHGGSEHVTMPHLAARLLNKAWGLVRDDDSAPEAAAEWAALSALAGDTPAALVPLRMRGDVIAVLLVGAHASSERLHGPDREAVALLAAHFALAVDHACVRAELEAEGADAAALSAASADMTAALDDRTALTRQIVDRLMALRDVRGVALLLYDTSRAPVVAAACGSAVEHTPPPDARGALFALEPYPRAWLPLIVGEGAIGALCVRWSDGYVVREHDRRLLAVYANGAAMALEHARLYERARILAERDPVTDLYNHRAFHARLEAVLERARARAGQAGLLLIDLADFKLFNDTHGHQAGDQALRRVAEMLRGCCQPGDAVARLGGDEFAVLLPDADPAATRAAAERVGDLAAGLALTSPEGQLLPVRLSIGLASFPDDAGKANALLALADQRLYEAKRTGMSIAVVPGVGVDQHDVPGGRFGMLESLVAMVDNRDRYTSEHSEQVATYACALAAELGLSHETIEILRLAGLLHDVGKIGVPDRILRKPGALSDDEFEIMRRHVELSEALVTVIAPNRDLLDAVGYHHERWDGLGYPRGAAGEETPLLGRIMIVADAVSAMGMDRPYRKGLAWERIAQELVRGTGTQFDPALVEPALRALQAYVERAHAA